MGFGDTLSRLFHGEKEARSSGGVRDRVKEESPEVNDIPTRNGAVEGEDGFSQNEEMKNEETKNEETKDETASSTAPVTKEMVLEVMSNIYDPEIPVDIVNLGLVYDVDVQDGSVHVKMTLTSPGCPTAGEMVYEAQTLIEEMPGVKEATVEVVWDPPWDPSKMSEEARQALGYY
ncbi:MAG TPA: iron-sulfur cluster assembly protein [Thermodesulfobacteriota bacterium]|nr:iron-sulfur cluster assembly protein [Thermodesulfobacteriota bacterium]